MKFNTNVLDLWTFYVEEGRVRYLLLHVSEKKSEEQFNGADIWQVPSALLPEVYEMGTVHILYACLENFGLEARALWTVEQAYTKFNRHRDNIETVPVFAALVDKPEDVPLSWHHDEYRWVNAAEARSLLVSPGLLKGLEWVREAVTEAPEQRLELRMDLSAPAPVSQAAPGEEN